MHVGINICRAKQFGITSGNARWDGVNCRDHPVRHAELVVVQPALFCENTARAQKFARQLRGRFGLQVFEVDERYSTTEAHAERSRGGSGFASGAKDADAASACIILEQFLRNLP